jgi:hypothetical protein
LALLTTVIIFNARRITDVFCIIRLAGGGAYQPLTKIIQWRAFAGNSSTGQQASHLLPGSIYTEMKEKF